MEIAKCTENNVIYTAAAFSRLPLAEIARKRHALQCPECGSKAFYRATSFNGSRTSCFGARPHAAGCHLGSHDLEQYGDDALFNPERKIIVDFNCSTTEPSVYVAGTERTCRSVEEGGRDHVFIHRRLSSLLRILIEFPEFQNSGQLLQIQGYSEITAHDFFIPLLYVTDQCEGLFRGYWGVISSTQFAADKSLWLNSGGRENISFCLDSKIVDAITKRYGIDDPKDLAGAYILVFGTPRISQHRKLHIIIEAPEYMALRFA